ncbi:MAG: hypothetical protein K8T89_03270 [Planctomycetes bacterium]|nr:hypothetical protein [Planctomycetota bacterium]
MSRASEQERLRILGLLGVGLDGEDGHRRQTRTDKFILIGGSAETHERMQETAIKFEEALEKRGKRLQDAEVEEVIDLLKDAQEGS